MSALLPEGCRSLVDAPYVLHDGIVMALHFLRFEELPREEQPPRRIWLDKDKLSAHWNGVERMRKQKYGVKDDGASGDAETNAAASGLIL